MGQRGCLGPRYSANPVIACREPPTKFILRVQPSYTTQQNPLDLSARGCHRQGPARPNGGWQYGSNSCIFPSRTFSDYHRPSLPRTPLRTNCSLNSGGVSMSTRAPASVSTTAACRVRRSRGSSDTQVSHRQPTTGTPNDVPVPRNVSLKPVT